MFGRVFLVGMSFYLFLSLCLQFAHAWATPVCWHGATRLACLASMPTWFGWPMQALAGWLG